MFERTIEAQVLLFVWKWGSLRMWPCIVSNVFSLVKRYNKKIKSLNIKKTFMVFFDIKLS